MRQFARMASVAPDCWPISARLQSTNGDRRRDVIATVFDGVINRMISGYLMRDVINLVDGIHFDSSEEIHTLARLYESMLREMRDAAGDSGEFYTPRPVIQFMVAVTDPKLGEVVLDPACGTGGFLAEAFAHLEKQCKTVQDRKALQETKHSWRRGQAAPLHAGTNEPVASWPGRPRHRVRQQPGRENHRAWTPPTR